MYATCLHAFLAKLAIPHFSGMMRTKMDGESAVSFVTHVAPGVGTGVHFSRPVR